MTLLNIKGSYNVRDLGGFSTENGQQTKTHVLIRSGNLDKVTPAAQQKLLEYGIKTVVDVRDEWEAQQYPNVFAQSPEVEYLNLPLIGGALADNPAWLTETRNYAHLHDLYIKYLERCKPQIGAIIMALAMGDGATIFHCHAGKDRTGIIAGLLLDFVNVPVGKIAEDYSLSSAQILHLIAEWREYALKNQQDMERFARDVASTQETMLALLAHIQEMYTNTENYLQECGVSHRTLVQLKGKFLTD